MVERSDILGVAARSTRRRKEESRLLGLSEKTDLVFPFSDLDDSDPATARGFGRRPLLLISTSLGDGEPKPEFHSDLVSVFRLKVTTVEDQEDGEFPNMHLGEEATGS
ncbi:hypothetical protein Bca4012_030254 [Brassica carinata]